MLDNLYDEYAKLVEDVMTDHDRLLKEALDLFAQTGADVQDVIRAAADEYGYEMTAEMEKVISSIEGMGSLDTYLGVGGTITQSLGDIVNEVHNAYTSLSSDFQMTLLLLLDFRATMIHLTRIKQMITFIQAVQTVM